jgi:hypothetical protein
LFEYGLKKSNFLEILQGFPDTLNVTKTQNTARTKETIGLSNKFEVLIDQKDELTIRLL